MHSQRPQRRVGLRRENLGYHLHDTVGNRTRTATSATAAPAAPTTEEVTYDHPPESSGEDEEEEDELRGPGHQPPSDEDELDELADSRPAKRRKVNTRTGQDHKSDDEALFGQPEFCQGGIRGARRARNVHTQRVYSSKGTSLSKKHSLAKSKKSVEEGSASSKQDHAAGEFIVPRALPEGKVDSDGGKKDNGFKKPRTIDLQLGNGAEESKRRKAKFEPFPKQKLWKDLGFAGEVKVPEVEISAASTALPPPSDPGLNSPLSSLLSDLSDGELSDSKDPLEDSSLSDVAIKKKCPICGEQVLASVLRAFAVAEKADNGRLNIRQRMRFCRHHRDRTARSEWKARKYPDIDWGKVPSRVAGQRRVIQRILEGDEPSVFSAKLLEEAQSAERGRRQRVANEVSGTFGAEDVGYYGGRGARLIAEKIVELFSARFKDIKQSAAIVAAGGASGFIQKVLVPEVSVRLVQADLKCNAEEARATLKASAELGRLLCEEENDEVHVEVDDVEN